MIKKLLTVESKRRGLISVAQGSVVDFEGDAIVNAANSGGVGGGGVDGAINRAGGRELVEMRQRLPEIRPGVRIPPGEARTTRAAGALRSKYVIHAVGPNFFEVDAKRGFELLRSAYVSVLNEAEKVGAKTIGSALLSCGIYRGEHSVFDVLKLTFETLESEVPEGIEFTLVAFSDEEATCLKRIVGRLA